jgi:hypothetical protein
MTRILLALPLALTLAACVSQGPSEPYAFVGSWDCGGKTLTFSNSTYNDGIRTYPVQAVAKEGMNYTLFFANGQRMGLGLVTATGMTRVSGTSGNQQSCRRL